MLSSKGDHGGDMWQRSKLQHHYYDRKMCFCTFMKLNADKKVYKQAVGVHMCIFPLLINLTITTGAIA